MKPALGSTRIASKPDTLSETPLDVLRNSSILTLEELTLLNGKSLPGLIAENLIENAIGYFQLPLGLVRHFNIDGREILIPMAVEDPSIFSRSNTTALRIHSMQGKVTTSLTGKLIIGQIQIPNARKPDRTITQLTLQKTLLIQQANTLLPGLVARGGGIKDLVIRQLDRPGAELNEKMIVIHLLCDPCDAMGANIINQVCEGLKPEIENLTNETVGLCILSNLVDTKLAIAKLTLPINVIGDEGIGIDPTLVRKLCRAADDARKDPDSALNCNQSVLNGIDPVLLATGNDWRAVEAGAHAYAARSGTYQPLTTWTTHDTALVGRLELPMAVGTVGGVTRIHPTAKVALKILKIKQAHELARVAVASGLIQNFGTLLAKIEQGEKANAGN